MSDPTIPELRDRAWQQASNRNEILRKFESIFGINKQRDVITLDKTKVDIQYIQDGIDMANSFTTDMQNYFNHMNDIVNKHNECKALYTKLGGQ